MITIILPETAFEFIDRFLITAEAYRVPASIIINKTDLADEPSVKIILTNKPTSESPTLLPSTTDPTTISPTLSNAPTFNPFPTHPEPNIVDKHGTNYSSLQYYYNYNISKDSKYGPSTWQHVLTLNSTAQNYWSEFGLIGNQCNDDSLAQSPIDVCTKPERHCMEHHEFRSKVRESYHILN